MIVLNEYADHKITIFPEPGLSIVGEWIRIYKFCTIFVSFLWKKLLKVPQKLKVLYKSDNFIVIDKEPDLLINSNDPRITSSLHLSLCKEYPALVNSSLRHSFHFVHRLDYVTSGVICIGLNKNASSAAAQSFQKRLTSKFYLAILRGHVSAELIDIDIPIGEKKCEIWGNRSMTVFDKPENCVNPRRCITRLLVLERGIFKNYPATKVLLKPITGRRHQLRVHCSHLGHTIVGDFTYSNRKDVSPDRTFLHALRLMLPNDVEPLDIRTEDPFKVADAWTAVETLNVINNNTFMRLNTNFDVNSVNVKL